MSELDPYYEWLGISPDERPVSKYRLLELEEFEEDAETINSAVMRQTMHLRTMQAGQHANLVAKLLNEVSAARIILSDPVKKSAYDEQLRGQQSPPQPRLVTVTRSESPEPSSNTSPSQPAPVSSTLFEFPIPSPQLPPATFTTFPLAKPRPVKAFMDKRLALIGLAAVGMLLLIALLVVMIPSRSNAPETMPLASTLPSVGSLPAANEPITESDSSKTREPVAESEPAPVAEPEPLPVSEPKPVQTREPVAASEPAPVGEFEPVPVSEPKPVPVPRGDANTNDGYLDMLRLTQQDPGAKQGSFVAQKQAATIDPKKLGITIPGRVNPIYAEFYDFTVSLERGKTGLPGLLFMADLTQHLAIPSSGRIYWVVHSRLKGFRFFEVPVRQDELPPRLKAFIQDFPPSAAPFQTFLIRLEDNKQVSYLTRAAQLR